MEFIQQNNYFKKETSILEFVSGHQIIGLALGRKTTKLKFGHEVETSQ